MEATLEPNPNDVTAATPPAHARTEPLPLPPAQPPIEAPSQPPAEPPAQPPAKSRPVGRWRRPLDYYLLWLAVIVSLAINAYLLNLLLEGQRLAGVAAGTAAESVAELANAAIDYNVEIRETIPVSLTVRYHDLIKVPISYTLPINTNVAVPLRTPLGVFPLNFPVVTSIGISLTPMIPISIVVPISHVVPIAIAVPIHIDMQDTPFGTTLVEAEGYLEDLAEDLKDPTLPGLPFWPTPTP